MKRIVASLLILCMMLPILPTQVFAENVIGSTGVFGPPGYSSPVGGVGGTVAYRVGFIDETFVKPLDLEVGSSSAPQVKDQFKDHFPNKTHSIILAEGDAYRANASIAWYNASSGQLSYKDGKVTQYTKNDVEVKQVYFNELKTKASGNISNLAGGKWKVPEKPNASTNAWAYILSHTSSKKIDERMEDFLGEGIDKVKLERATTEAAKKDMILTHKLHYLDLMITLHTLAASGAERDYMEGRIEQFIKASNLDTHPPLIGIDTIVRVNLGSKRGNVYVASQDYISFVTGINQENNLYRKRANRDSISYQPEHLWYLVRTAVVATLEKASPNYFRCFLQ